MHRHMTHASPEIVTSMMNDCRYGMKTKELHPNSDVCVKTKQSKARATGKVVDDFKNVSLHIDVCEPLPVP